VHIRNEIHCAVCDSRVLINLGKIGIRNYSVTSDTQICSCAPDIYLCNNCNLLQKIYRADELAIILKQYAEYTPHHLSGGREQLAFPDNAIPLPRTALALQHVKPFVPLTGKLLDFGTGNGALLRSAVTIFPDWTFDTFDIKNSLEEDVLSLTQFNRFFSGDIDTLPFENYELITLWHVLEHINSPVETLQRLGRCLATNGYILLQVPDIKRNPFDLAVIDHTLHFNNNNLDKTIKAAGFDIVVDGEDWFHNGLTLLIRPAGEMVQSVPWFQETKMANYVGWLKETCSCFERISEKGHYAIFGTGMASIWISSQLPGKALCFIDEDPSKHGKLFQGIPIVGPDRIPLDSDVLLPFLPETGERIINKLEPCCRDKHINFHKTPII
jgi:SAM-dependent methyltransferase